MTRSELWILSEWLVAVDKVKDGRRDRLVAHRFRTPYAEVDLLFENERTKHWTIVEVKTWNTRRMGPLWAHSLITCRQVTRLKNARLFLEAKAGGKLVKLRLAVVEHPDSQLPIGIRYFDLSEF